MPTIPKIKIEFKANELMNTASAIAELPFGFTRQNRTKNSILNKVCNRFLKKQIENRYSLSSVNVSLEFHEADYLEQYLLEFNGVYRNPEIQRVIEKLNQKLA